MKHPTAPPSGGGRRLGVGLRAALAASLILAGVSGCGGALSGEPQPVDLLRWPGALRVGADGRLLYVVGTDFDLSYGSGVVQSIHLPTLDQLVDARGDGRTVVRLTDVPFVGGVQVSPFGGQLGIAEVEGTTRLFVPIRGGDEDPGVGDGDRGGSVAVIEASDTGVLSCWSADGSLTGNDCRSAQVPLVTPTGRTLADPYSVVVAGDDVFVGSLSTQLLVPTDPKSTTMAYAARLSASAPEQGLVRDADSLLVDRLLVSPDGRTIFAAGKTFESSAGVIRSFEPAAFDRGLSGTQQSFTGAVGAREITDFTFSADGDTLYALSGGVGPSALLVLNRTGPDAADLEVTGTVSLPAGPVSLARFDGPLGDLLAVTSPSAGALAIVDPERLEVVGLLDGTACENLDRPCPTGSTQGDRAEASDPGRAPYGLVAEPRPAGGVRLWVGGFDEGALRAVDIPDPARPWEARVVAVFTTGTGS